MEIVFPQLAESEDERIRKRLIEYFEGFRMGNVEVRWEGLIVQEVLAWLEKQKEQKPAEWSEDIIRKAIKEVGLTQHQIDWFSIEEAKENRYAYKETDGDTSYDHEIAWLKSLRPVSKESLQPHWKPSEEQMKALNEIINTLAESKYPHESDYLFNMLNGLRKNLKKL